MHDPASQWFRKVVAGLFLRTGVTDRGPETYREVMSPQVASKTAASSNL